jgi:transcriptional regulator with XRE-family HTH domain
MPNNKKSRSRDSGNESSLISDASSLAEILKATRLSQQLSQAELAGKLGLRQRQISDLERATIDPRLSTIHNVARALGLELMLIPHHLISAVNALQRPGGDAARRPLYALGDEETLADTNEPTQQEVGDSGKSSTQPDLARRRRE